MKLRLGLALCLTALPALTTAALADTREQVMLRLPRCAAITDTKQYLDCYYAAVAPMRAELKLAPAPQSATYEPLFSLGNAPSQASGPLTPQAAAVREDAMLRLTRCSAIGDTRQYMDCYYAAAQPMRADLGLAAAPQAATYAPLFSLSQVMPAQQRVGVTDTRANLVPQTAYTQQAFLPPTRARVVGEGGTSLPMIGGLLGISSRKVPEAQFGFRNAPSAPNGVDHIASRVTSFQQDPQTRQLTAVTLENGQVWRQVANDDMRARWSKGASMTATIAYGAGGSYNLSVGEGLFYKVGRVR